MNIEFWQKQLKEYDELEEIAHSLYSKLQVEQISARGL